MINKKISIITVCKNAEQTIKQTIESVIFQSYPYIEYIIIDGNSTDATVSIINKYIDFISEFVSEPDDGIYDAMNKGIKKVTGDYVAFLNSDDWYEEDVIKKVADILNHDDVDIFYGKVNYIKNERKEGFIGAVTQPIKEDIYFWNIFCHQGLFIKRQLFETVGLYDCNYKIIADYDWLIRANKSGYFPHCYDLVVANYRTMGFSDSEETEDEFCRYINNNYRDKAFLNKENEKKKGQIELSYLIRKNNLDFLKYAFSWENCYIWGFGYWGQKIYDWLVLNNIQVDGVISQNLIQDNIRRIKTISFENLKKEEKTLQERMCIVVATEKYEEEIKNIIIKEELTNVNCLLISDIFKKAFEYYCKMDA